MSSMLATASIVLAGLLPVPIPGLPGDGSSEPPQAEQEPAVAVSGVLSAADGRLKRGCKDYRYAYYVSTESDDWTFDITMQDSTGRGVNSQSLLGPNDPKSGVLHYRLCRWATVPGQFTLKGALVAYDYDESTTVAVGEQFTLRKTLRKRDR